MTDALNALSPLDGRYGDKVAKILSPYFSEFALIEHRLVVQAVHLDLLVRHNRVPLELTGDELSRFLALDFGVTLHDARMVKGIEKMTNHDVKACEIHFGNVLESIGFGKLRPWLRFGMTSEDDNNLAYGIMLIRALHGAVIPGLTKIVALVTEWVVRYEALAMLSRTHGQPATPTTLGKEFAVFVRRLVRQVGQLEEFHLQVKFGGASGNHAAAHAALPDVDWLQFASALTTRLRKIAHGRLEFNPVTTQIEPHDTYAELFHIFQRINVIFTDFVQDIWRYVSDDWIVQRSVEGEVGSSAMPHKVNPIDFENAEGNLGIANALFEFFARKLPISRLQRDLSDSTVERNFGVAFGHSLLAYQSIARGMKKIAPDERKMRQALEEHPEVITEAYQTILRREGVAEAYDTLKAISRGKKLTLEDLQQWVRDLEISETAKEDLIFITPDTYFGLAPQLSKMIV